MGSIIRWERDGDETALCTRIELSAFGRRVGVSAI